MSTTDLQSFYRTYIAAVNALPPSSGNLAPYLASPVIHNDRHFTPAEYRALILDGSTFTIDELIVDERARKVAARLSIEVVGREKKITENVFYVLNEEGKIQQVWSMVEGV
ncbi:hypothetical protein FB45DRAFT_1007705 [Roridomyces roridus]|uniref:SnoaL-like domain-containing protein n=1 Tax=Roridomyces roridus TaxID=1738132 RepID=A0AAD7BCU7_9AGAR|nr:hypothetical protein FB45DRAFT_1007705 [Roridomyces roridus]